MDSKDILKHFEVFLEEYGRQAYLKISEFLDGERARFEAESKHQNQVKARQGWVSVVGKALEQIVLRMIQDFCKHYDLRVTNDKALEKPVNKELDQLRRNLEVFFGKYSLLPDGDLILYCPKKLHILAILSVKNSFRERYTETPYWKLKLKESEVTKHIRVFMVTPDRDSEISFSQSKGPRKARIVLEYELDGIYLARRDFDPSSKIKSIEELIVDLEALAEEHRSYDM